MNNKERLEWAAKAAGYDVSNAVKYSDRHGFYLKELREWWNPLDNDADAFRLAVDLKMSISYKNAMGWVQVSTDDAFTCWDIEDDERSATRNAIVSVAVQMEGIKSNGGGAMSDWIACADMLPQENIAVNTAIFSLGKARNCCELVRKGNIWFTPKENTCVYYTPTHWRY